MTTPVNNISLLDDLPNAVGGLSAAELKARFDKAGGDIQTFLNETLIPAIEQMGVDEGAARDEAIQAAINALELDTTVENLQKAIAAAESRAKEYADNKDAANLTAAKQYADTKAAAAQSAAESTAATDAASKADAALLSAKSYANQQDAVTLLNADAAAKNYANQQDAATLQSAKEYTDGKIPSKLPNPQKLKFTGAVTGEYDGSAEKTINIPTGGGDVPAVLGNLAAQIGDAAAGTIPVYAGDEAWAIEKLITEYNEATPLSGYIPDTAWVAAYMAAQKELLKLLPDSAAADAGKLLQVGADGNAAWGAKLPTALKNPQALTFTGAATGTYDGSEALTVNIPAGGSSGSGGALKAMSAVNGYIGIPAAELPENGVVWMCIADGATNQEYYSGTITMQGGALSSNNMVSISSNGVIQLNQVAQVSGGIAIYGMSAVNYTGVYQVADGGGASEASWHTWDKVIVPEGGLNVFDFTMSPNGEKLSDHQVKGVFIYSPLAVSSINAELTATLTVNGDYVFSLNTFARTTAGYLRLLLTVENGKLVVSYFKRDTDDRISFPAAEMTINKEDLHFLGALTRSSVTVIGYGQTLKLFNQIKSVKIESSGQVTKDVEFDVQVMY